MVITIKITLENSRIVTNRSPLITFKIKVFGQHKRGCLTLNGHRLQTGLIDQCKGILRIIVVEVGAAINTITELGKFLLINNEIRGIQAYKEFYFLID